MDSRDSGSLLAPSAQQRSRMLRRSATRTARSDSRTMSTQDKWAKLDNLKQLRKAGFISQEEFDQRKQQLIDKLTGTTTTSSTREVTFTADSITSEALPIVTPRDPPDFSTIQAEKAVKYLYDLQTNQWHSQEVWLKLDATPFARGNLRLAYHMKEERKEKNGQGKGSDRLTYVAKISLDPRDQAKREIYFRDVEMQDIARHYATQYNGYNPPKRVEFLKAWIFELIDRENRPICGVERFITGAYRKHNNNYGYVSEEERNTPQAFSHFTYHASKNKLCIVDIQGVGDMYTDPQIHSTDGQGFGKANLGQRGIDKFLATHRCNAICRYLKLPIINWHPARQGVGTLPVTQFMSYKQIAVVNITRPANANTPLLPPRIVERDEDDTAVCRCAIL